MRKVILLLALFMGLSSSGALAEDEQSAKEGFKEVHQGMKKVTKAVDKNAKKGVKAVHNKAKKDAKAIDKAAKEGWKQAGHDIKKATKD